MSRQSRRALHRAALQSVTTAPVTIGIDVGGTKIAALSRCRGQTSRVVVEPTSRENADALVNQVARMVAALAKPIGAIGAVGLSVAGEIAYEDGVVMTGNLPLSGLPLRAILKNRLELPVFLDNDGNCAAIAEAHRLTSDMSRHLVVLTLGTGVGGGAIINGQLLRGHSGLGAELGHLVVWADGPDCFGVCPNRGCLEALCSGAALARDGRMSALRAPGSALAEVLSRTGRVGAEDVVDIARTGDLHAQAVMRDFGRWLGVGLSSLINIFEPVLIAIGGGLSQAGDLFLSVAVDELASRTAPARREQVKIQLARSGPHASVVGASLLASRLLRSQSSAPLAAGADAMV